MCLLEGFEDGGLPKGCLCVSAQVKERAQGQEGSVQGREAAELLLVLGLHPVCNHKIVILTEAC